VKNSRFSEEQIIGILKQSEAGAQTSELCRQHGISTATFYGWRSKYGGLEVSETAEAARRREREAEAHRGRSGIGHHDVEGSGWKKMVSPQDRRAAVAHVRQAHGASERRACGLVGQPRSTQR